MKLLLLLFMIISSKVFPAQEIDEIFRLSSFAYVESNAKDVANKKLGIDGSSLKVERVGTSEWFAVQTKDKQYVIDKDAKYWLEGSIEQFFIVEKSVNQVNFSNSMQESMIQLMGFVANSLEYFTVMNPVSRKPKRRIYVFVDLSCPHCKKFHLISRTKWDSKGIQWVYVPFLRNPSDNVSIAISEYAFCAPTNSERLFRINEVYLMDKKQRKQINPAPEYCSKIMRRILDFSYTLGQIYNFRGSPLFLTESGKTYYGIPALQINEFN